MSEQLFVYGTLHPDQAPDEIVEIVRRLEPIGSGSIRARFHTFPDYPAIKLDPKARKRIDGNVFRIPNKRTLKELDEYEEYYPAALDKSLFKRELVKVQLVGGASIDAWVYEYNRPFPLTKGRPKKTAPKTQSPVHEPY